MKIGKTDKRYSGHPHFKHFVAFGTSAEIIQFNNIRQWCWETFGPSSELEIYHKIPEPNKSWCWELTQWSTRIYFAGDKEFQWFTLKWR